MTKGDSAVRIYVAACFLLILMIALTLGCGERSGLSGEVVTRDSAGVRIVEVGDPSAIDLPLWKVSALPIVTIGSDDPRAGHDLFGVRGARILEDGRVVIANGGTQELRFFAEDGVHLANAGGKGEGPGEFTGLFWLDALPGDTLLAYDIAQRRLSTFSSTASFLTSVRVTPLPDGSFPEPRGMFADGHLVFVPGFNRVFGQGERRDTVTFLLYDRLGQAQDTLAVLPGREEYFYRASGGAMRSEIPFGRDVFVSVGPDAMAIGTNDQYEVSLLDQTGHVKVMIRATPPLRTVTEDEIRNWQDQRLARVPEQARALVVQLYEEIPAGSTHPAFSDIQVDDAGYTWIGRSEGNEESPSIWEVYSPSGTPTARVSTPLHLDILEIGQGYILGRTRDELDREVVHVYRLSRS